MAFKKTFIVSDETVNSYGFWLRTLGIRLDKAKLNCPCFFNHETWRIPLGHWENFRIDDTSRLLADLVIEGANEEERLYIRKIESGDIKGASVGVDVISMTDDIYTVKPGQTRSTVFECELFEISITPLPGNSNALSLRYNGCLVTLSSNNTETNIVPLINKTSEMKSVAQKLGLSDNASETQVIEAIVALQQSAFGADAMRIHIEQQATEYLHTDAQKHLFATLCKSDISSALQFLQLNRATETVDSKETKTVLKNVMITDLIQKGKAQPSEKQDNRNSFDYLQKHNPAELARIKSTEPEQYQKLVADYGKGIRYQS
jgi:HK97 family phage prohead protease